MLVARNVQGGGPRRASVTMNGSSADRFAADTPGVSCGLVGVQRCSAPGRTSRTVILTCAGARLVVCRASALLLQGTSGESEHNDLLSGVSDMYRQQAENALKIVADYPDEDDDSVSAEADVGVDVTRTWTSTARWLSL